MKRLETTIINKTKQLNLYWLDFKRMDVIVCMNSTWVKANRRWRTGAYETRPIGYRTGYRMRKKKNSFSFLTFCFNFGNQSGTVLFAPLATSYAH